MSSAVWIGRVAWAALRGILLLLLIALFFWGLAAVLPESTCRASAQS